MLRTGKSCSAVSYLLCSIVLFFGVFTLVKLRSDFVSTSYELRTLEEKKIAALKETKTLLAERSKLISVANLDIPLQSPTNENKKLVSSEYVFPDRVRVIHVAKSKGPEAHKASYQPKNQN